jgi:hypothetical protein
MEESESERILVSSLDDIDDAEPVKRRLAI